MEYAKINYDAWRAALPERLRDLLPEFHELSSDLQHAYCRAANTVLTERIFRSLREH
jgi:hypothetical protein